MLSFAELAAMDQTAIPEVKLMPAGPYRWAVSGAAEVKPSASGASELVNFRCKCVAPDEDFPDPTALEEFGNPSGTTRTLMFTVPKQPADGEDEESFNRRVVTAVNRIKDFLFKTLVMEAPSIQQALAQCDGYQFVGDIKWEADNRNPGKFQERLNASGPIV